MNNDEYMKSSATNEEGTAESGEILNLFGESADESTESTASDIEDTAVSDNGADDTDTLTDTQFSDELVGMTTLFDESNEYGTVVNDVADTADFSDGENETDETESEESDGEENESDESEDGEEDADEGDEADEGESEAPKEEEMPKEKPRRVDTIFDFLEICIFTLAGVFILMSFFFRYSIVDGGSMMNTLQHQERLILTNFLYTPECGDIVVVQDKSTVLKDPIVKRVIAVGGQTVKFTRTDVYVDGVKLDEPYVYTGDYVNPFGGGDEYRYSVYPSDALLDLVVDSQDGVYYEILVPEGEIFVMGDHRNNSKDSREIGTLHEEAIIGKAVYRFFPFDKIGKIE